MDTPMFDRYGEWPTEPLAVPDPNAPVNVRAITNVIIHHTGMGTITVLDAVDPLELERQEIGL